MSLARITFILCMGAMLASCGASQSVSQLDQPPQLSLTVPENVAAAPEAAQRSTSLQVLISGEKGKESHFALSSTTLAEGNIDITLRNGSKKTGHAFIVAKMKNKDLPIVMKPDNKTIDAGKSKFVEQVRVNRIGSGKLVKVTLILREGYYMIYCPAGGHYSAGESAMFMVLK